MELILRNFGKYEPKTSKEIFCTEKDKMGRSFDVTKQLFFSSVNLFNLETQR
jgi:hypothetical protein